MKRKGQSAIEYLFSYGWMLLVVSMVGGTIFAITSDATLQSVSGFSGDDVQVDSFGVTSSDSLELLLRNAAKQSLTVKSINVTDPNGRYTDLIETKRIRTGKTDSVRLPNVQTAEGSRKLDVEIIYDIGGLEGLSVEGTISSNIEISE